MAGLQLTVKQREANRLLAGPARNIMLRGGSRSGKTFVLVRAIIQRALNAPNSRHVIFRFRFNHVKTSVWSDTLPKALKLCFPQLPVRFDKTDFYIELPNGSQIWIAGLDDKDRVEKILGQEYVTLYFNESSQIPWSSVDTAMSRLAQKAELAAPIAAATGRKYLALKAYFDCNPPSKLHWSYQLFRAKVKPGTKEALPSPDDYVEMRINPADNAGNLPPEYFAVLESMSAAKRVRFEAGEWSSEVSGALWSLEDRIAPDGKVIPGIDSSRVAVAPDLIRVVVAVDPSGTRGPSDDGDSIGIVVAGKGADGRAYVLADRTCKLSPDGWGKRSVAAYREFKADRIVAERNFGGAMVEHVIRTIDARVSYKEVTASRGKIVRAEPVAALYEQGRISHVGTLPDLEDQMCLAKGTLIETSRGQIPVEEVTTRDLVLTRNGFAPLRAAGYTGMATRFVEIQTSTSSLLVTECHPIFLPSSGEFVSARNVKPTDSLLESPNWERMAPLSHGAAGGITECRAAISGMQEERSCTGMSMRHTSGLSLTVAMFITRMKIMGTICRRIFRHSLLQSIMPHISERDLMFSTASASEVARYAGPGLRRSVLTSQIDSAQTSVHVPQSERVSRPSKQGHLNVGHVEAKAKLSATGKSSFATSSVRTISGLRLIETDVSPVFNLSVAEGFLPEYYANGILTHNCSMAPDGYVGEGSPDRADALVWALTELMLEIPPGRPAVVETGFF